MCVCVCVCTCMCERERTRHTVKHTDKFAAYQINGQNKHIHTLRSTGSDSLLTHKAAERPEKDKITRLDHQVLTEIQFKGTKRQEKQTTEDSVLSSKPGLSQLQPHQYLIWQPGSRLVAEDETDSSVQTYSVIICLNCLQLTMIYGCLVVCVCVCVCVSVSVSVCV